MSEGRAHPHLRRRGGAILPEEIAELHDYGIERIYHPDDGQEMGLQGMTTTSSGVATSRWSVSRRVKPTALRTRPPEIWPGSSRPPRSERRPTLASSTASGLEPTRRPSLSWASPAQAAPARVPSSTNWSGASFSTSRTSGWPSCRSTSTENRRPCSATASG